MQDRRASDEAGAAARVEALVEMGRKGEFDNAPDSDPDLPGNHIWGREIADRMVESKLGDDLVAEARVESAEALEQIVARGVAAADGWQALGADERARILYRAGERLEARRGELLEVMGSECGKTLDQGDPEVSEAIDFAHYYAMLGQRARTGRRRAVPASAPHRGRPAVELPGRDPRGRGARGPRRRIRRHH